LAESKPRSASQGTAEPGSASHVAGIFFRNETGTRFQFVPYRGAAQAILDLVSGQIDMMITDPTVAVPQVRAGAIKAYAVTAKNRLSSANEIPTVDEAGLPGFYISYWQALFAPKGTPAAVIEKVGGAVVDALADSDVLRRFADNWQGIFPRDQQTPGALAALQKAEIEKWWPILKAANIKPE
jgi:tripartite-type tricarboxylate transporter receptor subunit TctC